VEGRSFFGPGTALLGPRVLAVGPGPASPVFRIHLDAGIGWGTARDTLGDVSVTLASGGLGFALVGGRGVFHFDVGPNAEFGWAWIRGVAKSSGARGATLSGAFGSASVRAGVLAALAPHWGIVAAIDLGLAFSGVEAQADGRSVARTAGPMLGARAGLVYAF
jgi:hypothetical protein